MVYGPNKLMDAVAQATTMAKNCQDLYLIAKASIFIIFNQPSRFRLILQDLILGRAHIIMGKPADAVKVLDVNLQTIRTLNNSYLPLNIDQ